jgi:hypothetical protein
LPQFPLQNLELKLKKPRPSELPPAPKHLKPPEAELWRGIVTEHAFTDVASLALLRTALETHQRARLCREAIDADGITSRDRFGQISRIPCSQQSAMRELPSCKASKRSGSTFWGSDR